MSLVITDANIVDRTYSILRTHNMTSSSWVDSSVGRALHRHRRGHGFESSLSLNLFQAFFWKLLKLRSNCEDLSST